MQKYIWPTWLVTIKLLSSQVPRIYTISFILFISCCTGGRYLFDAAQIQAFNLQLIVASAFLNLKTHFIKHITMNFCFHLHPVFSDNTAIKIICVGIQNAGLFFCSSGCLISLPGFLLLASCHVQRMVLSHNPVANAAYIRPWGSSRCLLIHTHTHHSLHTPCLAPSVFISMPASFKILLLG